MLLPALVRDKAIVLIADDDQILAEAEKEFFETLGCSVLLAQDGSQALELTRGSPSPTIVFLDLNMPLLSGEQYLDLKNEDPKIKAIPVVVVSGHSPKAPLMGVSAVLPKPCIPADLRDLLERCIRAAPHSDRH